MPSTPNPAIKIGSILLDNAIKFSSDVKSLTKGVGKNKVAKQQTLVEITMIVIEILKAFLTRSNLAAP